MGNIFFAFGPDDSFVFSGPKAWQWNKKINDHVYNIVQATGASSTTSVLTSEDRDMFVTWTNGTMQHYCDTVTMKDWPEFEAFRNKHGGWYIRATSGAGGKKYVAWHTGSSDAMWNLDGQGWAFQSLLNIRNQGIRLKNVAIGVNEACFIMVNDERWWFNDTNAHYPTLHEILKDMKHGDIEFLAINPFKVEQFFLLRADQVAIFRVPLSFRKELVDMLGTHGITCRDLSSQRAEKAPRSLPAATKESGFLKGIVRDVSVNSFGSVIGGVASALVGAAACTIM